MTVEKLFLSAFREVVDPAMKEWGFAKKGVIPTPQN
jgi:hypothetical protein